MENPADPMKTAPATVPTITAGITKMENYDDPRYPTRINPDPLPPTQLSSLPDVVTSTLQEDEPPTASEDAVTSTTGDTIVFSLSEAIKTHYGHIYTKRQIKEAFRVWAIREYFSREWSKLYEQARDQYVDGIPATHDDGTTAEMSYRPSTSVKLCWYHKNFRMNAKKCRQPCRYKTQILLLNNVVKSWLCLEHSTTTGTLVTCNPPCPMQPQNNGRNNRGTKFPQQ